MIIVFLNRDKFFAEPGGFVEKYRSPKRNAEYNFGRFLVKTSAKYFYNIDDTTVIEDKKPYFACGKPFFSISHSENLVFAALDDSPVGFDVEKTKPRDFEKLCKHFNLKTARKLEFYEFWTQYEAAFKNRENPSAATKSLLFGEFMLCVSANEPDFTNFYELIPKNGNFSFEKTVL